MSRLAQNRAGDQGISVKALSICVMSKYIAFLRAINVGGRTVKMERLRELFAGMGFTNVATFIASGNVIFDAAGSDKAALERTIEEGLRVGLGFHVDTFVRTTAELAAVVAAWPFDDGERAAVAQGDNTHYITFLGAPPDETAWRRVLAYANDVDSFHIDGREVYWLCRRSLGESTFSAALLERALGMPGTLRNARTVERMAKKYA